MFKTTLKTVLFIFGLSIIGAIFYFTEDIKRVDLNSEVLSSVGKAIENDIYEKGIYFGENEFLSLYKIENDDSLTIIHFDGLDIIDKAFVNLNKDELVIDEYFQGPYQRILTNFNIKNEKYDVLIVDVN